jgi:hypothetical protein
VCAGVVAVIEVLLTTLTLVAAVPPKLTVAPEAKFVPVIVTTVPPLAVPDVGEMAVTVGAGGELDVLALKVTICMIQLPPLLVAVAVLLPVLETVLSSAKLP